MTPAESVFEAVGAIKFGTAQTFRNLTLVPLVADEPCAADYAILDEALALGTVRIGETSEAGRVPELKVLNHGDQAVFLLDGEELIGAKQNRVLNLSILVPPHSESTIPVSCVEAGRWSRRSAHFGSTQRAHYAEGRSEKMQQVTASLRATGTYGSDQGAVWASIERKMSRLGARSETAAMAAMYEDLQQPIEDFVSAFRVMDGQVGAMFLVNGRPGGIELFDATATWRKLSSKLIQPRVRTRAVDTMKQPEEV